jgi:hypothetical protein
MGVWNPIDISLNATTCSFRPDMTPVTCFDVGRDLGWVQRSGVHYDRDIRVCLRSLPRRPSIVQQV